MFSAHQIWTMDRFGCPISMHRMKQKFPIVPEETMMSGLESLARAIVRGKGLEYWVLKYVKPLSFFSWLETHQNTPSTFSKRNLDPPKPHFADKIYLFSLLESTSRPWGHWVMKLSGIFNVNLKSGPKRSHIEMVSTNSFSSFFPYFGANHYL